jgi:hypothetical protein
VQFPNTAANPQGYHTCHGTYTVSIPKEMDSYEDKTQGTGRNMYGTKKDPWILET